MIGTHMTENTVAVDILNGSNSAHSSISACVINHNETSIRCADITLPFTISNTMLYHGDINLSGVKEEKLRFVDCDISSAKIIESLGASARFDRINFHYDIEVWGNNGQPSHVVYQGCFGVTPVLRDNGEIYTEQKIIDDGLFTFSKVEDIQVVSANATAHLTFDTTKQMIPYNRNFTKKSVLVAGYAMNTNQYITAKRNTLAVKSEVVVSPSVDIEKFGLEIYDLATGEILGEYTAGRKNDLGRKFYFNGSVRRSANMRVRIVNQMTYAIGFFTHGVVTPCYFEISGL